MNTHRIFVEKKIAHDVRATQLLEELTAILKIAHLKALRVASVYDIIGMDERTLEDIASRVFFEPARSVLYQSFEALKAGNATKQNASAGLEKSQKLEYTDDLPHIVYGGYCAMEFLPGQYDQRADAAMQCLSLLGFSDVHVSSGQVLLLYGSTRAETNANVNAIASTNTSTNTNTNTNTNIRNTENAEDATHKNSNAETDDSDGIETSISTEDLLAIRKYCINTIEMREKDLTRLPSFTKTAEVEYQQVLVSLNNKVDSAHIVQKKIGEEESGSYIRQKSITKNIYDLGLSMDEADIDCLRTYFEKKGRSPTLTEVRVLDTYWSDHCRHTTFLTALPIHDIKIADSMVARGFARYIKLREKLGRSNREISLMDIATIGAKSLIQDGHGTDIDISEEINACSVRVNVEFDDGSCEPCLLMFKNETHNHPTEIEPYGGASTCLGGAIRDPLSGRAEVFAGMRISGSADPRATIEDTLAHKLPQRFITQTAALGFSSYGNQVGISNNFVKEIYHEGFLAKRLEAGFVMGIVQENLVRRECPVAGDVVLLVGGRTGRDGIGGAVGSSKKHSQKSVQEASAEVQKGNPIEAHALLRLFSQPQIISMIKRCNDFGAGGVAVAVGELADGVSIDLDKVLVKYCGLNGTELAISESQERMAVVVDAADAAGFVSLAEAENLEATAIAEISSDAKLVMSWRGNKIVEIDREFLDSHGARRSAKVKVVMAGANTGTSTDANEDASTGACTSTAYRDFFAAPVSFSSDEQSRSSDEQSRSSDKQSFSSDKQSRTLSNFLREQVFEKFSTLQLAAQHGLQERFDASIGGRTVLMPYGGYRQESPAEGLACLLYTSGYSLSDLPEEKTKSSHPKTSKTVALASLSCPIDLLNQSPYIGAAFALVQSLAKIVAMGGNYKCAKLSFQEYFRSLGQDPLRWGDVMSSLLGALEAQMELEVAAIGGKDSMSGSYENLHVPPTFISFAVSHTHIDRVRSTELKSAGQHLYLLTHRPLEDGSPDYHCLQNIWHWVYAHNADIASAISIDEQGLLSAMFKMCVGNNIGLAGTIHWDMLYTNFLYNLKEMPISANLGGAILVACPIELDTSDINNSGLTHLHYIGKSTKSPRIVLKVMDSPVGATKHVDLRLHQNLLAALDISLNVSLDELREKSYASLQNIFSSQIINTRKTSAHHTLAFQTDSSKNSQKTIDSYEYPLLNSSPSNILPVNIHRGIVPQVCIPVFPGTNCEKDTARCFELLGARCTSPVFLNKSPHHIPQSIAQLAKCIADSQIFVLAGGFSLGDEPDGSGKYIANILQHPDIAEALRLLLARNGLILGICNGFQALVKSGWLPYGEPRKQSANSPTLTNNLCAHHISRMVDVRVQATHSPWLANYPAASIMKIPVSHGEGRFFANEMVLQELQTYKQIATCYASEADNPNGSVSHIESISSRDGKIYGRMGHAERIGIHLFRNIPNIRNIIDVLNANHSAPAFKKSALNSVSRANTNFRGHSDILPDSTKHAHIDATYAHTHYDTLIHALKSFQNGLEFVSK